jgi:polar amino acid transport system permease protein
MDYLVDWAPRLAQGMLTTIGLTVGGMAFALVVGLVLALARLDKRRWYFVWPAQIVVELIRGTPLLVQLFYIFYVLPFLGLRLDPIPAGILGLGLNYAAYLSEVFRSGIEAVPRGQWEAADALGMSHRLKLRRIVLPQAFRIVIPPVGNYFIALFKDSALVATISISELLFTAQLIASETFRYVEVYTIIFIIYFAISYPASLGVRWLERRLRVGGK